MQSRDLGRERDSEATSEPIAGRSVSSIAGISGICTKRREVANNVGSCPVSRKGNCKKAFLGLLAIVLCDNKVASSVQENSV